MIGGNGSYVEDQGTVVLHQLITPEQCRHIVDWLHGRGLEFYLESNNGLFASEKFEAEAVETIRLYSAGKGKPNGNILSSYQDYLDACEEFPDLQNGTWGGAGEKALFGDMGVKNISKAYAIERLVEYLQADRKDTIAFEYLKLI